MSESTRQADAFSEFLTRVNVARAANSSRRTADRVRVCLRSIFAIVGLWCADSSTRQQRTWIKTAPWNPTMKSPGSMGSRQLPHATGGFLTMRGETGASPEPLNASWKSREIGKQNKCSSSPIIARHRIEVNAVRDGERWNADVMIRRTLSPDKPLHERVRCYKLSMSHAEQAGMLWARRYIDSRLYLE